MIGSLPIGSAMGFSCVSAAEANAAEHEAEVRSNYQATETAKPFDQLVGRLT